MWLVLDGVLKKIWNLKKNLGRDENFDRNRKKNRRFLFPGSQPVPGLDATCPAFYELGGDLFVSELQRKMIPWESSGLCTVPKNSPTVPDGRKGVLSTPEIRRPVFSFLRVQPEVYLIRIDGTSLARDVPDTAIGTFLDKGTRVFRACEHNSNCHILISI